ncbi:hypothetical protein [Variovorax sp. YR752]|uniref:hypothetical protein n=1 Tax=Variovorax sp. YR752 TaxID=1884383 RepID=UPI003137A18A
MESSSTVTVYSFRIFELDAEAYHIARFKAPRHVIRERYRGEVLEGTGEEVDATELDGEGRYRRIATGWGALD